VRGVDGDRSQNRINPAGKEKIHRIFACAIEARYRQNADAFAGKSVRVVHTSSIVAIGASRDGKALNEDSQFPFAKIKIDYVQAKRVAEEIALEAADKGKDVVVVNPGYLIGPEDHEPSVMGKFCARAWKGQMPVAAPGGYNLVDVRDVAAGHILAATRGVAGRRYVLGGDNCTMAEFLRLLAIVARQRPRAVVPIPTAALWAAAVVAEARALKTRREPYPAFQHVRLNRYRWFVDSERAHRELGFRARPIEESLNDAFRCWSRNAAVTLKGFHRWWLRPAA
jgi:dihydroflavonol-4-reductase